MWADGCTVDDTAARLFCSGIIQLLYRFCVIALQTKARKRKVNS